MVPVTGKITWPKYSEGAQNIVWQSEGAIIEDDVSSLTI